MFGTNSLTFVLSGKNALLVIGLKGTDSTETTGLNSVALVESLGSCCCCGNIYCWEFQTDYY